MNTYSQNAAVLKALLAGETITALQALNRFGILRLAARIADLRAMGHDVRTINVKAQGKRFARYYIPSQTLKIIEAIPAFPSKPQPVEQSQQTLF
jgi:hypothetical protein